MSDPFEQPDTDGEYSAILHNILATLQRIEAMLLAERGINASMPPEDIARVTDAVKQAATPLANLPKATPLHEPKDIGGYKRVPFAKDVQGTVWTEEVLKVTVEKSKKENSDAEWYVLNTKSGEYDYDRKMWKNLIRDEKQKAFLEKSLGRPLSVKLYAVVINQDVPNPNNPSKFLKLAIGIVTDPNDDAKIGEIVDAYTSGKKK